MILGTASSIPTHPGNVFYLPGNRIAFIDFGMVGGLTEARRYGSLVLLRTGFGGAEVVAEIPLDWRDDGDAEADPARLRREIDTFRTSTGACRSRLDWLQCSRRGDHPARDNQLTRRPSWRCSSGL